MGAAPASQLRAVHKAAGRAFQRRSTEETLEVKRAKSRKAMRRLRQLDPEGCSANARKHKKRAYWANRDEICQKRNEAAKVSYSQRRKAHCEYQRGHYQANLARARLRYAARKSR